MLRISNRFDLPLIFVPVYNVFRSILRQQQPPSEIARFILFRLRTHISHLRLLCLKASTADENMVEEISAMISVESLISSYTVKRPGEQDLYSME